MADATTTDDGHSTTATASTTTSVVVALNNIQINMTIAEQHNKTSNLTIMCEKTRTTYDIPYCGNDYNNPNINYLYNNKKHKAWWSQYGYGYRLNGKIYCTVTRRREGNQGCRAIFASAGSSSSSFLIHLSSFKGHNVDEIKHKAILNEISSGIKEAEKRSAELAAGPSSSTSCILIQQSVQSIHNIFISKIMNQSQQTLEKYLVHINEAAKASYNKPFNRENFQQLFLDFHIANQLPYNFVENNQSLQNLINFCVLAPPKTTLNDAKLPCRKSMATYTRNEYSKMKLKIIELLMEQESLNFTTDIWTSETGTSFMSVTCHFIAASTWTPQQITLALRDVSEITHTGENMAQIFVDILKEFKCLHLLNCITCDNASNNLKMAENLEKLAAETNQFTFKKSKQLIPCYAHVVNLVTRDIIDNSVSSYAQFDDDNDDTIHESDSIPPSFDHDNNNMNNEPGFDDDDESAQDDDNSNATTTLTPLQKLRLGCKAIKNRSHLKHQFNKFKHDMHHIPKLQLKKDCPTRWNSTRDMIERYLLMKDAYKYTIQCDQEMKQKCFLTDEDDEFLIMLNEYLEVFHAVTLFLCSQRHTTINKTIQLINVLYDTIEDFISNNECSDNRNIKSLVHASKIALCKLQKYYTKTDDNEIYACATMLDCNLKFDYWSESEWEAEVIQQQKNACMTSYKSFLESQFAKRQQPFTTTTAQEAQPMHSSSSTTTTTSTAHNTFNDETVPSSSALSSSTSSSTATLASGRVKKSFGFFGKRKKINNINETKRQKTDGLSDYIEEGILELHLYTTSDDTDTFPPLELEYYATKIDDDLILIDEKVEMTMKEEGFAGQTLSSLDSSNSHSGSIPLPVPSKFLLNQSIDYSQLNNNLNFATQSLDFWRLNHIKYPKLSSFALQILAVPSTSVASERLFSTAKRIININRASLSGESAELLVVLSSWKKHQCDA